jgi:hypothetical protein
VWEKIEIFFFGVLHFAKTFEEKNLIYPHPIAALQSLSSRHGIFFWTTAQPSFSSPSRNSGVLIFFSPLKGHRPYLPGASPAFPAACSLCRARSLQLAALARPAARSSQLLLAQPSPPFSPPRALPSSSQMRSASIPAAPVADLPGAPVRELDRFFLSAVR